MDCSTFECIRYNIPQIDLKAVKVLSKLIYAFGLFDRFIENSISLGYFSS